MVRKLRSGEPHGAPSVLQTRPRHLPRLTVVLATRAHPADEADGVRDRDCPGLDGDESLRPYSDTLVAASYTCAACGQFLTHAADVAQVAVILTRRGRTRDVRIFDGHYIRCSQANAPLPIVSTYCQALGSWRRRSMRTESSSGDGRPGGAAHIRLAGHCLVERLLAWTRQYAVTDRNESS